MLPVSGNSVKIFAFYSMPFFQLCYSLWVTLVVLGHSYSFQRVPRVEKSSGDFFYTTLLGGTSPTGISIISASVTSFHPRTKAVALRTAQVMAGQY